MLILATVTISAITDTNFIGKAIKGTEYYNEAVKNEEVELGKISSILNNVARNLENGGYFEEAGTINGGEKGSYNPTIPAGFRTVDTEGASWGNGSSAPAKEDVENGLVIEDKEGNQFVWVPCYVKGGVSEGEEGLTQYARHIYTGEVNDRTGINSGDDEWTTEWYRVFTGWNDPAESYGKSSVNKYGGFYVARFEAGIPEDASFYPKASNNYAYIGGITTGYANNEGPRNTSTDGLVPTSKKNTPAWTFISQENAKTVSERVAQNSSVKSYLIDCIAWDTIVNWINQPEITIKDSTSVGNYYKSIGKTSGRYVIHTRVEGGIKTGDRYESEPLDLPGGQGDYLIEVYTGSMENTKLKNIYDMAGNVVEMTTETGTDTDRNKISHVERGGECGNIWYQQPLANCFGHNLLDEAFSLTGFRTVLYLT